MKLISFFFFITLALLGIPSLQGGIDFRQFVDAEVLVPKRQTLEVSDSFSNKTLPDWMLANIRQELENFEPYTPEDLENYFLTSNRSLVHFRIRNGRLSFRSNEGTPSPGADYAIILHKILTYPGLNIESGDFLLEVSDGVGKSLTKLPVFCFSKHHTSNYISVPDEYSMGDKRPDVSLQVDKAAIDFPWESKIDTAFWIGAANGAGFDNPDRWIFNRRAILVLFALENPDIVWAKFTDIRGEDHICSAMQARAHELCAFRYIQPYDSCQHKYLIDVDGHSSAFHRCQWILRSNCVSIKQQSGNVQWYYSGLKPYVHYVPYETDCSDMRSVIMWLRENDEKAKEIALEGRKFALEYLDNDTTYLYLYHVLKECNKLNKSINI